ncbi:Peptidase M28 [Candidatus Sulfopaludibacter sp. SbA6]|nr:Peptidase M28 [Candidatus Sulfopaludibacter sp. SbA6]
MNLRGLAAASLCCALFATEPNDRTRRWWSHVEALANDGLEGRDTGSEGYRQAARYVVTQFERAGLKPAGESGYYQSVPLHVVRLRTDQSEIELVHEGAAHKLEWLRQITMPARTGLPETLEAGLVFAGSGDNAEGLNGKILVQLGGGRRGAPAAPRPGIAGTLTIDATGGPEPPRWPVSYSVAMSVADVPQRQGAPAPLTLRFNPAFADVLFEGSGHTYKELADLAAEGKPLPRFPLPATLRATLRVEAADLRSDNILATLPGSDPALASEYIVVSAHLDGYGIGEPWNGDRIYNGAFDDAAYVATLIDMAQRLRETGQKLKRSLLFAVVTGEEKGLLGSKYFAAHPTIRKEQLVADINLDQLRPIFPLKTLTTLALDESTLGDTVKQVAEPMGIRIQADLEPERRLLTRSDHYSFMQIGVPAVGFIFGYEKGSPEEVVYRRWYAERYHSPADDLQQPWDPPAAAKFNDFFNRLVETLANAAARPRWKPGSAFAR